MTELQLHPRTVATLSELSAATWFSAIGLHDSDGVVVLSSWDEAIQHCGSAEWEHLLQEAANQYRERLVEAAADALSSWNARVAKVKALTTPIVDVKTAGVAAANRLPRVFVDTVQWDILHVCMEAEYADVFPPGFYASQAFWYVRGHFPCGWRGAFPQGQLIVY
jgi:hypothetical protein